jgi:putative tryptophan/tyrosine transport system permease protein
MNIHDYLMICELGCIYGLTAMGLYWSFRLLNYPDLSCDGTFVLGAISTAVLIQAHYPPVVAVSMAALFGLIAGSCTGILHTFFKIPTLLTGILIAFMLYSVNLRIMHNIPNIVLRETTLPFLTIIVITFVLWGLYSLLLHTHRGLALRTVGQNPILARQYGLSTAFYTIFGLALSNACISLSGALFSMHQGFADISQGFGTLITSLAAILMGEQLFPSTRLSVRLFSCIAGAIIYRIFIHFALQAQIFGLRSQDLNLITGLLIIAIIYSARRKKRANAQEKILC